MLEHIIESARNEGFVRFVISIHYLGHMIEEHLFLECRMKYHRCGDCQEQEQPEGDEDAWPLQIGELHRLPSSFYVNCR